MELETVTLETVSEEPIRESQQEETEPETAGSEQLETTPETQTEPESVSETSETEEPEETETESETETAAHESPVSVSGNAAIFLDGYGYIAAEYSVGDPRAVIEVLDIQTEVIREQTAAIKVGFASVCVLLGFLIGVVFIQGIRLRRV